ncbi:MAG TPA: FAD-dependent oxidoreductase [Ilumatobacteraceae bacterium]|nr:FAD-dependent oxidoreductase [Ilumatobacteraceae bacterium]
MSERTTEALPVAIIGAGPVGLAAAAHLAVRGLPFVVFERGPRPATAMAEWGHVTFFSPWRYVVDAAARRLLEDVGWSMPDPDRDPTGRELVDHYLLPLAAHPAIAPNLRCNARVVSVTRLGMDRVPSKGREERPFEIVAAGSDGTEDRYLARAVIDASGTWSNPNPAGASGVHALGERAAAARISYGIPDVFGTQRERFSGRRVMVIGSGHSAMDSILSLTRLRNDEPSTEILWAMRSTPTERTFGGLTDDQLASRGALGERAKAAVDDGAVQLVAPFRVHAFRLDGSVLAVTGETGRGAETIAVDEVIVATGFRPDFSALSELRLDLHPWLESPRALGPLIDPNEHSCGTVPPHGEDELKHPEHGVYIVGMKSYGRAPTFLMITGYEQVRSVVAALAGDWEAARDTQLVLPETGVCHGPGIAVPQSVSGPSASCAPTSEVAEILRPASVACCGS